MRTVNAVIWKRQIRLIAATLLASIMGTNSAEAQSVPAAPDGAPPTVAPWIEALESDIYTTRVRATEQLILAGRRAIAPVALAVEEGGGLETISRGTYILRQLALIGETPTQDEAYETLKRIAERPLSGASRRATTALQAVHEMRYRRAQAQLAQMGAVFLDTTGQAPWGTRSLFPSIVFGSAWRGTPADFAEVRWITGFQGNARDDKWMISIEDHPITDEWINSISLLENVVALKFKSAPLPDEAIVRLAELPHLEVLEVLYTPITDATIESLASLPRVVRLRLIGTKITSAGVDRLKERAGQIEIDYRNGGFLGISCTDNPCRINLVQPNTAAAAAGLRVDDIITGYNGQPVTTMEHLTRLISEHTAGEKVTIELLRDDKRIQQEVELGAWD